MQIKIGTRNSPLALWQAREVARNLQNFNYKTEITPVLSSGDKNLDQPLYAMGITGIFTKDLDVALLNNEVDIAVHSLKDVPTQLPEHIEILAYLERDYPQDVLVRNRNAVGKPLHELKIATSSLRRRAFWLRQFPGTEFVDIRGNVQTRLQKIEDEVADATLFSLAGLKRLNLNIPFEMLAFMVPAPSQGVVVVVGKKGNEEVNSILRKINHPPTQYCVETERKFLRKLEGGCTAPIGAFAEIQESKVRFIGMLTSLDGKNSIETDEIYDFDSTKNLGESFAEVILQNGGREIMNQIKTQIF